MVILGMACIHQSFVDGTGSPIQLMGSPKPSPDAYKDKLDPSMFESLVTTQLYTTSPAAKGPGKSGQYFVGLSICNLHV